MLMHRFVHLTNVAFYSLNSIYIWFTDFSEEDKDYIPSDILSDKESLEEMCTKLPPKQKKMDKGWGESPQIWI